MESAVESTIPGGDKRMHPKFTCYLALMVILILSLRITFAFFLSTFATPFLCNERFRTLATGIPDPLSSSSQSVPTTSTDHLAEQFFREVTVTTIPRFHARSSKGLTLKPVDSLLVPLGQPEPGIRTILGSEPIKHRGEEKNILKSTKVMRTP